MSSVPKARLTSQQYLEQERKAEFRSEFYHGETFAMAGASRPHHLICTNLVRRFAEQFGNRDCEVYQGEMRVKISATELYVYPDVVIACKEPVFEDSELDTLLNPRVLVEVLSKSTETYDRGTKWKHYQSLPSLCDYLLVSQTTPLVERYTRTADNQWLYMAHEGDFQTVKLDSIECQLQLDQIYAKVGFETAEG